MTDQTVSIVIPVRDEICALRSCLEHMRRQSYPSELTQILVVNNSGNIDAIDFELACNVTVVQEPSPGSYVARNQGLEVARGEIIGFTDADCLPEPSWIENAVRFLGANPSVSRIAGSIDVILENNATSKLAEVYDLLFAFPQDMYTRRIGAAATANMFARRAVFQSVGFFREDVFSGGDVEWGSRAQNAGYKIEFVKEVAVGHPARKNMAQVFKKAIRVGGGMYYLGAHPFMYAHLALIKAFIPPISMWRRAWRKGMPLGVTCQAMAVHYMLKFVKAVARLKVAYGLPPRRI